MRNIRISVANRLGTGPHVMQLTALLFIAAASCKDLTSFEPPPVANELIAVSPTQFEATVGNEMSILPSVQVIDSKGKPVGGITVTFVAQGGSFITGSPAITDQTGIARVTSWRISTTPGINLVIATAAGVSPITFTARAKTGPVKKIRPLSLEQQFGVAGQLLAAPPAVRITDYLDNPVAGVAVTFDIVSGSGSLNPRLVVTDSVGVATTAWTLGSDSLQVVSARADTLPAVLFKAIAIRRPESCVSSINLAPGSRFGSELDVTSCRDENGHYQETFIVSLGGMNAWKFDISNADFNSVLELRDENGALIGISDNDPVRHTSTLRAILPHGFYRVVVTSVNADELGQYAFQYLPTTTSPLCGDAFVARGLTLTQVWDGTRCTEAVDRTIDRYRIQLDSGVPLSLILNDMSYDDPRIELFNESGELMARGVQTGYYVDTIDFTPEKSGIYTIVVTAGENEFITYGLNVK